MNRKTILILKYLMDGNPHKVTDLAGYLKLSPRLVRYELEEAYAFLEKEGFPLPKHQGSAGVCMMLSLEEQELLKSRLASLSTYDYVMTSSERRCIMLLLMLASGDRPLTGQYFADQMSVSKSSIDKDMILLKADLEGSGVRLESRVGKGSSLEGDEWCIRNLGVRMLEQHLNFSGLYQKQKGQESADMVERYAYKIFCDETLPGLFKIMQEKEKSSDGKQLAYDSFRMIVLTLAVMLVRVRKGRGLSNMPSSMFLVKTTNEYIYAMQMAKGIEGQFGISLPDKEICSLALLLISAEYVTPEPYLKDNWVEVQVLLDCLVRNMSKEMGIDFTRDAELYQSLQQPLGSTVFCLRHGIPRTNPNLSEIKREYRECFNALMRVGEKMQNELLRGISEDDLAWLTLPFCASAEQQKRSMAICKVAIVCMHGVGTANLLREAVSSRFANIRVVATLTFADMEKLEGLGTDFIISSILLPSCTLPWVKISAIPTDRDWENIGRMILKYSVSKAVPSAPPDIFRDVMDVVQRHCQIDDMDKFTAGLVSCLESNGLSIPMERIQPSLPSLLTPDKLRCHQYAANWEDAVGQACNILIESGDATEEFKDSAIYSVKKAGPYVVIMPGVVLVHGDIGKGVRRLSMSMVTLKKGVCFHHPSNDPVQLVFCLAPIDNWSHIHALRGLLNLLEHITVQTLCKADTPQKLYEYLRESGESLCS
ncbi:PRD domain-containing protein [Lachnospiraceae bacterium]|nr:PRD domain-containing protein [Lachnospiraceae bacterium]